MRRGSKYHLNSQIPKKRENANKKAGDGGWAFQDAQSVLRWCSLTRWKREKTREREGELKGAAVSQLKGQWEGGCCMWCHPQSVQPEGNDYLWWTPYVQPGCWDISVFPVIFAKSSNGANISSPLYLKHHDSPNYL